MEIYIKLAQNEYWLGIFCVIFVRILVILSDTTFLEKVIFVF